MESIPLRQALTLPVGFRFRPSDEELITDYLLNKVKGEELPWDGIRECDMYAEKPPWQICGDVCDQEEKVYFFTRLKKLSKNRVARTAGCGVWHENSTDKIYDNQGDVIGARKLFCFKVKEGSRMKKSDWIMHEFSLVGEQERTANWVLCTVQKKGQESRSGVKRKSCGALISAEIETPQPCINTDVPVLLLEDGTRQSKKMRCDVEYCDGPQLQPTETPSEFGTPGSEFTLSQNSVDIGEDMEAQNQMTDDLETFMTCLPAIEDSEAEFYASYGYLPPPTSLEGGHLPLGTWMDFSDAAEFFDTIYC